MLLLCFVYLVPQFGGLLIIFVLHSHLELLPEIEKFHLLSGIRRCIRRNLALVRCVAIMRLFDERTKQPNGLLHGGASVVLAETLGSVASFMLVAGTPGARVAGLDINATHLKTATEGFVHGVCRPLRLGRTVHFWQIDIFNDAGEQTCSSRLTVAVSRPQKKDP